MLGKLFTAVLKTAILPVAIFTDVILAAPESAAGEMVGRRTKNAVRSIASDLDDVI